MDVAWEYEVASRAGRSAAVVAKNHGRRIRVFDAAGVGDRCAVGGHSIDFRPRHPRDRKPGEKDAVRASVQFADRALPVTAGKGAHTFGTKRFHLRPSEKRLGV